jgi:hypothetical protein
MPYFSFLIAYPLWYMEQIRKILTPPTHPEGVKSTEKPD